LRAQGGEDTYIKVSNIVPSVASLKEK